MYRKGCVRKMAVKRDPFYKWIASGPRPLVTHRCLEKCQVAKKAAFRTPHLPTTGSKVARLRQVWSQVMAAVVEIK